MMIQTFTWRPDLANASVDYKFNVREVKFGDGYEQRQKKGLKGSFQEWSVSKTGHKEVTAAIAAFFNAHGGVTAFYWTPPDRSRLLVKVREYRQEPIGAGRWRISWKFEEVMK